MKPYRMFHSDKIEILKKFKNEAHFRAFLIELLLRIGFKNVEENHGSKEKGKDIIAKFDHSIDGEEWYSFVVKFGQIAGSAIAINYIVSQISESVHLDYHHSKGLVIRINKVKVVTNDNITEVAKEKILKNRALSSFSNYEIWINSDLIIQIDRSYPEFWESDFFIKAEDITNKEQLYAFATNLLIDTIQYRASNVGPTFLHPDWLLIRTMQNKKNGLSLDYQLKNRILNPTENRMTKIILRNVKERYEAKLNKYLNKSERELFKSDLLKNIDILSTNKSLQETFSLLCYDIGFNNINLIFDHHVINTYRTRQIDSTSEGLLISNPKDVMRSKERFDKIFKGNYTEFQNEIEKLSGFVEDLWK